MSIASWPCFHLSPADHHSRLLMHSHSKVSSHHSNNQITPRHSHSKISSHDSHSKVSSHHANNQIIPLHSHSKISSHDSHSKVSLCHPHNMITPYYSYRKISSHDSQNKSTHTAGSLHITHIARSNSHNSHSKIRALSSKLFILY